MISKELLSEVFGEKRVILDHEVSINKTEIHYGHKDIDEDGFINIYELANKCKEWAYKQSSHSTGYAIKTVHYGDSVVGGFTGIEESYIDNCKTEYELVFKLCQWILDNKEQK